MSRWALLALAFCACGLRAADDPAAGMEEVLVEGEHPGPALWKVSKQSHTLFILGTHAPLPKDLVWRSREVESAIARANEVLGAYSVSLRVDQEAAFQSRRGRLKEILPARTYAQWRTLRVQYIGKHEETDRLLPTSANSWATGDVAALEEVAETDASYARSLAYSWPFLTEQDVQRLHTEAENTLLTAIERAVNRNEVTFAALPIHLLLRKDGVIARLRAAGYSIEEPA